MRMPIMSTSCVSKTSFKEYLFDLNSSYFKKHDAKKLRGKEGKLNDTTVFIRKISL